jgi:hypothetical protein
VGRPSDERASNQCQSAPTQRRRKRAFVQHVLFIVEDQARTQQRDARSRKAGHPVKFQYFWLVQYRCTNANTMAD